MSILIALFFSFTARPSDPSYPLHCKMKAVAGLIEARMDNSGKFSLVVHYQGRPFVCDLQAAKIALAKSESEETLIAFKQQPICAPKDIPKSFLKNLNPKMEWLIGEKSQAFFIEAGEPAASCSVVRKNKAQSEKILKELANSLP